MFVIKNSQLTQDVVKILNNLIELDIDAPTAFKLSRIIKELSSIYDDKVKIERKIVEKYTDKNADGSLVKPKDDSGKEIPDAISIKNMTEFQTEMENLGNSESSINYDKINFEDLKLKTAKIKDLIKLDFLFV